MNENEYGLKSFSSFEERENRRNQQKVGENLNVRNEFLFKTVATQFVVGALLVASLFALRSLSPNTFDYFKNKYNSLMKRDITFEEIASAFKNISFVPEKKDDNIEEKAKKEKAETTKAGTPEAAGGEDLLQAQDKTTFSPVVVSENLVSPLDSFTVTSRFGYRENPISGKYGFHTGLDMAADEGTAIKAAYAGVVTETGFNEIRGNYVVIEHSDNTVTAYYHCKKILCEIDQNVRQGQVIALVGSTGWSTGPHLHFEIRINGVNCNPEYLLNEISD